MARNINEYICDLLNSETLNSVFMESVITLVLFSGFGQWILKDP
jgi:hypothetical protein